MKFPNALLALISMAASVVLGGCASAENQFGIYVSRLDGTQVKALTTDPHRELNHARVSPDGKCVIFTRYNHFGGDGNAIEENGFEQSELMLMRIDGTDLQTLVAAKPDVGNANGNFTPDGKSVIFVSSDNKTKRACIYRIDLATKQRAMVGGSAEECGAGSEADPNQVGDLIVFTRMYGVNGKIVNQLWTMHSDGSNPKRLTNPVETMAAVGNASPPAGDFDPKLSPDGKTVVCMRHVTPARFDIFNIDIASGNETDLSKDSLSNNAADAVPEWSSDGKLLIFWHPDRDHVHDSGLWTMTPDGKDRHRVPLPRGFFYSMPAFFPHSDSSPASQIIFSARLRPGL